MEVLDKALSSATPGSADAGAEQASSRRRLRGDRDVVLATLGGITAPSFKRRPVVALAANRVFWRDEDVDLAAVRRATETFRLLRDDDDDDASCAAASSCARMVSAKEAVAAAAAARLECRCVEVEAFVVEEVVPIVAWGVLLDFAAADFVVGFGFAVFSSTTMRS